MEVPEQKAEEGELRDRVVALGRRRTRWIIEDHPRRAEPPPIILCLGRVPLSTHVRLTEMPDREWPPEGGRAHSMRVQNLQEALEVGEQRDQKSGDTARDPTGRLRPRQIRLALGWLGVRR